MKKIALILAVLLLCGAVFGCSAKPAAAQATAANADAAPVFTGKYVVDAKYVLDNLDNANVLLADARGEDAAKTGTVKGAIVVTWQLFASVGDGAPGDEMWGTILDTDRLSAALSQTGISPDREVILFADAQKGWGADGRIAWELIAAGFPNVKMVNGGYDALVAVGAPTTTDAAAFTPAEVTISKIDATHVINTDSLVTDYAGFKVVDVRSQKEYDGAADYGEAKGGHLPGAILVQFTDLFRADGTLKSNDEITAMFEAAGVSKTDKVVTYCTKGIRSAYAQLILEMCGFETTLNYDESYYRWSASQDVEK